MQSRPGRSSSQRSRASRRALAEFFADPANASVLRPIRKYLSAHPELNFEAIEGRIGLGRANRRQFRKELTEIIAFFACLQNTVEETRGFTKVWNRVAKGQLEAVAELPPDVRKYYEPRPSDDPAEHGQELIALAKMLSAGARSERRALGLDRGGRPALVSLDALVILLADAYEGATRYRAGVGRARGEQVFGGPFCDLVEAALAIVNDLSAGGCALFAQPNSAYSRGRKIERLLEKRN